MNPQTPLSLESFLQELAHVTPVNVRGRVMEVTGLLIRATVPGVRVGEICWIRTPTGCPLLPAEVVGFQGDRVCLMTLGDPVGLGPDGIVEPTGRSLKVWVGLDLLGRVLNGLGEPIDGQKPLPVHRMCPVSVENTPPEPMKRRPICRVFPTGIRVIDGLLTVGEGQRIGVLAPAGVGKSTLLSMLARFASADVSVIALIGERGREVREFIERNLGTEGRKKSIVVVATSDQPALVRWKAAAVATAIAEFFRDQGQRVLFLMDSVTRLARALREVGLAIGEPPARLGFPPSVFATLPRLLERTGNGERGSITAFYTVLVEDDEGMDPIADEVRAILDGHIVLAPEWAARGHFPAVDVLRSVSRVMPTVVSPTHREAARQIRQWLATYEDQRDLILLGAYRRGRAPALDAILDKMPSVEAFLRQEMDESTPFEETQRRLLALTSEPRV